MFQSVRPNSQIYIFHKGDHPRLDVGFVVNQPVLRAKYPVPTTFGQPKDSVVDLNVKVGSQSFNYNNIPASLDIADLYADGENIVISDNREAMNAEILSLKQKSIDVIDSIDYHKGFIVACDDILSDLNPELAEKQAQRKEIDELKNQMSDISKVLSELKDANRLFIEQLKTKGDRNNVGIERI